MAEGFSLAHYVTNLRLPELQGRRLWLVRVPRHIDSERLAGAKVMLPVRKGREGKVLGRVTKRDRRDENDGSDDGDGDGGGEDLVLRAANAAESRQFRALFSAKEDEDEDGLLRAAAPFAGQVIVSVETADLKSIGLDNNAPAVGLVEPYRGRPQLKGMRVRSMPAGAGSVYTPARRLGNSNVKSDDGPPATPDQARKSKKPAAASAETEAQLVQSPPGTPSTKKRKRRKSAGGEGRVGEGKREQETRLTGKNPTKTNTVRQ